MNIAFTIYLFLLIVATASAILVIYHSFFVIKNIKPRKDLLVNILAPFILFLPNNLTEKGNFHRKKLCYIYFYLFVQWLLCGVWNNCKNQENRGQTTIIYYTSVFILE